MTNGDYLNFIDRLWVCLVALFLFSCNSESSRVEELYKKIADTQNEINYMTKSTDALKQEMGTIWIRSLQYRFPEVRPLRNDEEIPIDSQDLSFLKGVRFHCIDNHTWKMQCIYQPPQKGKIKFAVYLFDSSFGINIHRTVIEDKSSLFHKIAAKQEYILKVDSRYTPSHFLIGLLP